MRTAGGASMIRYLFRAGLVLLTLTALVGCIGNSDSDEYGEDIDEFEAPPESDRYRARVLNGELEGAFVWLDMDGDGRFSSYGEEDYRADFEDPDEDEDALPPPSDLPIPEPWAVTDARGNVVIDTAAFDLDRTEAPDLDPDAFPLMAIGIPGVSSSDGETIEKAFFLSAPPGVTNVTPFSTMAETVRRIQVDRGNEADLASAGTTLLQEEVLGNQERIGPYQDYLKDQGQTAVPFYATAIRRLIQAQVPAPVSNTISNSLRNLETRPSEQTYFAPEDMRVIGSLVLDQAASVIDEVGADIEERGLDGYSLPPDSELDSIADFGADLNNPYVAVEQRYYIPAEDLEDAEDFEPISPESNSRLSAQVFLGYDLGVRLRRMDVRGRTRPSMGVFPFLVEAGGRPTDLGTMPWLDIDTSGEAVAGERMEREDLSEGDLDERFIGEEAEAAIDWETPRIGLDSSGFEVGGNATEVDGEPERFYKTPASGSYELVRANADNPGTTDAEVTISSASEAAEMPINQLLSGDWTSSSEVAIDYDAIKELTTVDGCGELSGETIQHANARQVVTLTRGEAEVDITRYGHQRDKPASGERAFRVMVETYGIEGEGQIRREYEYFNDSGELLDGAQPDLLESVRVLQTSTSQVSAGSFCDGNGDPFTVESSPDEMLLYIGFDYLRFADYLESIGTRD